MAGLRGMRGWITGDGDRRRTRPPRGGAATVSLPPCGCLSLHLSKFSRLCVSLICLAGAALLKRGVKNNSPGVVDDPPLYSPGNGLHLGAADPLQDLVRDRGACGGRAGGAWRGAERGRQDDL